MTYRDTNSPQALAQLLELLPEPPCGSVLIDGDGHAWQRDCITDEWFNASPWTEPSTWLAIIRDFGVVHVFADSAAISYAAAIVTGDAA